MIPKGGLVAVIKAAIRQVTKLATCGRQSIEDMDRAKYAERYRNGEWRTPIFYDLIKDDISRLRPNPVFLDIGCGKGFDEEMSFQERLGAECDKLIGVEPDPMVPVGACFSEVHRCLFEDAKITAGSVDLAWSVMVLEHVEHPSTFFKQLYDVLCDGGVFWGFTVDSRHYFAKLAKILSSIRLKSFYLKQLHGTMGEAEYRHYPAFYRCNCPGDVRRWATGFREIEFINFNRPGQVGSYLPRSLRPVFAAYDRYLIRGGMPGSLLAMRCEK